MPSLGHTIIVLRRSLGLHRGLYEAIGHFSGQKREETRSAHDWRGRLPHSISEAEQYYALKLLNCAGPLPWRTTRPQPPPEPSSRQDVYTLNWFDVHLKKP